MFGHRTHFANTAAEDALRGYHERGTLVKDVRRREGLEGAHLGWGVHSLLPRSNRIMNGETGAVVGQALLVLRLLST